MGIRGPNLRPILIDGHRLTLTPRERDIFAILFNARGGSVTTPTILAELHPGNDGGPDWAESALRVHVSTLRLKLAGTRFRIETWNQDRRMVDRVRLGGVSDGAG